MNHKRKAKYKEDTFYWFRRSNFDSSTTLLVD